MPIPSEPQKRATPWQADPRAKPTHRLGSSPQQLGISVTGETCPQIWQLDNGDLLVVGTTISPVLPAELHVAPYEGVVAIPSETALTALSALAGSAAPSN